ncbi:4a-hydroxytetrahydrobiopterin dehydratase [soil metagenome]
MALLDGEEIKQRLGRLDGWSHEGSAIHKSFEGSDFAASIELVNRIAPIAEEMGHHPDLEVSWDTVTVTISTHSEGGLTASDFELAERIDASG